MIVHRTVLLGWMRVFERGLYAVYLLLRLTGSLRMMGWECGLGVWAVRRASAVVSGVG